MDLLITVTAFIICIRSFSSALPAAKRAAPIFPYTTTKTTEPETNIPFPTTANLPADPTVAAIIGSSFLTLANRMNRYNNDPFSACTSMKARLNAIVEGLQICPWTYNCTYQENRHPQYILQAECRHEYELIQPVGSCNKDISKQLERCKPIMLNDVPVLIEDEDTGSGSRQDGVDPMMPCQYGCHEKRIDISIGCKHDSHTL